METEKQSFIYILSLTVVSIIALALNLIGIIPASLVSAGWVAVFFAALLVFIVWLFTHEQGWIKSLFMLPILFLVPFAAEILGVKSGLIFGPYRYTEKLGPCVFGTPVMIGFAWIIILYASFSLVNVLALPWNSRFDSSLKRFSFQAVPALAGAIAATAWDMMMDPVAVAAGWWVWLAPGAYVPYIGGGIPVHNFIGWLGVAFVCQLICRLSISPESRTRSRRFAHYGAIALYFYLFISSEAYVLVTLGRPEIALVGALSMGSLLAIAVVRVIAGSYTCD